MTLRIMDYGKAVRLEKINKVFVVTLLENDAKEVYNINEV